MPKVSVIIPNYNHAAFLAQRIDSILNQTFTDFELIIMDDCSTDNSRVVIEQYRSNPKVSSIIFNEVNSGGVFKQWVKGLQAASGKYIWIAESDDFADEDFLQETVAVMEQEVGIGMVFANTVTVDTAGKPVHITAESRTELYALLAQNSNIINRANLSEFLLLNMIIENASCALMRKEVLLSIDLAELTQYTNTGDRFTYIGIALKSGIKYIPKPLNYMRSHENNTTKKNMLNGNIHRDRLRVLAYYYDRIGESQQGRNAMARFYKNNYQYFITFGRNKDHIEVLKKLRRDGRISRYSYFLLKKYVDNYSAPTTARSGYLKGLHYRILAAQRILDSDFQK